MMANEKIDLSTKTGYNGNEISVIESVDAEYDGSGTKKEPGQFDLAGQSMLEVRSFQLILPSQRVDLSRSDTSICLLRFTSAS
jgi:hypothetical protein